MKMVCLRHGESEYNLRGLCNADPAVPVSLTPKGRLQAAAAAQRLRDVPIRRVYVSRLKRAHETAAIVNASHCADIYVDGRLDDRNTGYEGQPVAGICLPCAAQPSVFMEGVHRRVLCGDGRTRARLPGRDRAR